MASDMSQKKSVKSTSESDAEFHHSSQSWTSLKHSRNSMLGGPAMLVVDSNAMLHASLTPEETDFGRNLAGIRGRLARTLFMKNENETLAEFSFKSVFLFCRMRDPMKVAAIPPPLSRPSRETSQKLHSHCLRDRHDTSVRRCLNRSEKERSMT